MRKVRIYCYNCMKKMMFMVEKTSTIWIWATCPKCKQKGIFHKEAVEEVKDN